MLVSALGIVQSASNCAFLGGKAEKKSKSIIILLKMVLAVTEQVIFNLFRHQSVTEQVENHLFRHRQDDFQKYDYALGFVVALCSWIGGRGRPNQLSDELT